MDLEQIADVAEVARFLNTREDAVSDLLKRGRLEGVLIAALQQMGVSVTPHVKNSVEVVVRGIGTQAPGKSPAATSGTTSTVMFTDIVDSAAITSLLGDVGARDVLRRHDRIVRRHIEANGGTEVKSMGDGFMISFNSARRAVSCAVGAQSDLERFNRTLGRVRISVRMGLTVGEPIQERQDLYGETVIQAARISSMAHGGQILTSEIVNALVGSTSGFLFKDLGEFQLKGIGGVHRLYEVLWN